MEPRWMNHLDHLDRWMNRWVHLDRWMNGLHSTCIHFPNSFTERTTTQGTNLGHIHTGAHHPEESLFSNLHEHQEDSTKTHTHMPSS